MTVVSSLKRILLAQASPVAPLGWTWPWHRDIRRGLHYRYSRKLQHDNAFHHHSHDNAVP
jgi:hypothetical protein